MLEKDSKNYHVWSYRQWLVRRFELWEQGELEAVEEMLKKDIRNNSAWNHRWFVVFGRGEALFKDAQIVEREIKYGSTSSAHYRYDSMLTDSHRYAQSCIRPAPQNQSPWNYLRGTIRYAKKLQSTLKGFAGEFASLDKPDDVCSSHALDLLADIYAEEENKKEDAGKALDLLAARYDPIRANYWNYRKSLLQYSDMPATPT